jgi:hypothetical protein
MEGVHRGPPNAVRHHGEEKEEEEEEEIETSCKAVFSIYGFCIVVTVNSDYFLKQL